MERAERKARGKYKLSEYNHEDFPCEPRANTPGFNKGYEGIKWNDKHDDHGRVVKKGNSTRLKKGDKVTIAEGAA